MSRGAVKYGSLQYNGLKAKINFNSYSELSFNVDKALCSEDLWGKLVDFKLIWVKDWNICFEINVDINEDNGISKTITAKSLGESELAQVNLYNIEVNTEDDIERSDYVPTILYNEENHKASLIHRLLEKCPHYRIGHIDSSIAGAQRTFQFNNQSILDAFDTISKEIDCVFIIDCSINAEGDLVRTINIYDLEFSCVDCGHRWEHIADACPSCNGTNINTGYGEDTHIFISSKNLAQQINYTTSTGSVKNCFKLQAGDDLMTSAVINCNPNGGQYLWYISDEVKEDMSDELSQKIDDYEDLCEYYQNEYQVDISSDDVNNYNRIIQKYSIYSQDHEQISLPIVGYSDLVKNLYNVLDFDIYLSNELMPTPQMINTTAEEQVAKLTAQSLSPVSVTDLSNLSLATANNVVLGMARVIVDNRYKITIVSSTLSNNTWQGSFCVTNYSNDDDTSTSGNINITINDDYENFLKQKIDKALQKSMTTNETIDIVGLFKLDISDFTNEIKKYSLSILKSFYDNCQTCLDVLIEQGIANGETWGDKNPNLYTELYIPYRNKLTAIESEIALRESEVKVVKDIEDYLYDIKGDVQASLNLQAFLGDTLWEQFSAYRREDTYQNDNYISDGLGNSEMFEKAKAFIAEAQKNIYKSANLQHSISSTLKNLLMLREFQSLKDYFEEGNWLRIETDGEINRLRLMSYEVDYENTNDLSVEFSDVSKLKDGISDIQSVLDNSKSIASSFNAVTRQAKNGNDSQKTIDKWINSGIALNNIKIIQDAENQNVIFDNNGILCREYLPMIDSYDERQLKIINKGLFLTDDNWQSAKVGIGEIEYNGEKSYGVNAQLLIGDIIIGNELHIKDSQGQDIMTVIDGRISTEVTEVKGAAAAGTYEYYDPDNSSWSEKNNVDFFGYGISQDEKETDTGIKAAGNNNKYFLNKHNGNLYKSNGTKWVFQKTLSPKFNNYSTIAYTDNKASTAESNAKTAAANAMSEYDEGSLTINYYGFGAPTTVSGSSQGEIYLDQNTGYYYTKGSGSTWTKSMNALPLYADQKATEAYNNALSYVSTYYITSEDAGTAINQTKQEIEMTAAKAVNKYEVPAGITINFAGYGDPTTQGAKATAANQYYLDQETGNLYKSNSSKQWGSTPTQTLTLITSNLNSKIDQTAENVTISVEKTIAESTRQYFEGTIEIKYYGYGAPSANITDAGEGDRYLDQTTGYYYTKGSGSSWTKSEEPLELYVITARDAAVRMAGQETERQIGEFGEAIGEYLEEDFYTKTETKAEIKNDGEKISLEAVRNTVGYTIQSALETKLETATVNGLTLTRQSDGSYIVNGTCGQDGAGFWLTTTNNQQPTSISQNAFKTGQYLIKASGAIPYAFTIFENGVAKQWATIYDVTVTVDNADEYTNAFYLGFSAGTYDNLTINPLVYKATEVKQTVSSQLSVMADNISLKVNKNDLVSEINLSTDEIVLKGNRIRITDSSDTTKTLISGSVIQSGNYAVSSGVVIGTRIDLGNGAIYSKNFEINSSGNLTLSGGVIKTSNYTESTANTKTVGGKINLNVGSTSSDYLFDTANFKITGTGAVVATEANFNSCTLLGGSIKSSNYSTTDGTGMQITLSTGSIDTGSGNFSVSSSGALIAKSGTIGGWTINADSISQNKGGYVVSLSSSSSTSSIADVLSCKDSSNNSKTLSIRRDGRVTIGTDAYQQIRLEAGHIDFYYGNVYSGRLGQTANNELSVENTGIFVEGSVTTPQLKITTSGYLPIGVAMQMTTFNSADTLAVGISEYPIRLACTESYIDGSLNFYKYNADAKDYGAILFGNKIALRYWGQNESFCVGISDKKLQFYGTNVLMPSGAAVTSDARKKHNIESLDSRYLDIIKNIEPKRFQYNCNPLDRYHTGYIAQDVEKAMQNIGMDVSELSAFVDTNNDGTEFALRYGEFIPLLHKWIKEIDDRLTAIERKERNEC